MCVYVLNKYGKPLMPCSPKKAKHLLKKQKAKVKKRTPFTIQLLHGSSGYKQIVTLGVDAGSKTIGMSACTQSKELYAAEIKPRNDVVNLLSTRREYRRTRRNRKTRYRKPKFYNRVKNTNKQLAPSVEVKIQEHITSIKRVISLLPIAKIVIETAEFDTHKLKAMLRGDTPPVGADYMFGEMYNEYNVRQYILKRDDYRCQHCGIYSTEKKGVKFHVHHLESRKTGGNSPDNLITLCEKCHKALHKGKITLANIKRNQSLRDATFMGVMRKTLIQRLRQELNIPILETHGYITKYLREKYGIKKDHLNDARCITGYPLVITTEVFYLVKPVRRHNRRLHKSTILKGGIRKSNIAPRELYGFRLFDKVRYNGADCFIWGRRSSGSFLLRKLDGEKVKDGVSYKKLTLLERETNYLIERRERYLSQNTRNL